MTRSGTENHKMVASNFPRMVKELNIQKMRAELIEIYEGFLKNPNNPIIQREAYRMYTDYMNAGSLLKEDIGGAVNFLSAIIQYKDGYQDGTYDREEMKQSAREILKRLKK